MNGHKPATVLRTELYCATAWEPGTLLFDYLEVPASLGYKLEVYLEEYAYI